MSNEIIVSSLISKNITEFFEITNAVYSTSNHEHADMFKQKEYAPGETVNVKIPGSPPVQRGLVVTASAIQDLIIPYTVTENDILSVARNLNSVESSLNIIPSDKSITSAGKQAIVDNYSYPAYQVLAAQLEEDCINSLLINSYLTPIDEVSKLQPLNNFPSVNAINVMATYLNLPKKERVFMTNMTDSANIANSLQNMFNTAINTGITKDAFVGGSAEKGRLAGMDMYHSEFLFPNISGPLGESNFQGATVASVAANGLSITITGVTATTGLLINAGDMISIPSVNLVNEVGHYQIPFKLVVKSTTDAFGDGAGNVTITLPYPLMASGEHQNVTAIPAVTAPVFFFPSYNQNYMYTKSGLSTVPLKLPKIYGAVNSDTSNTSAKGSSFPVSVTLQGANLQFSNNYRIASWVGKMAFAPYVISVPSAL